MCYAVQRQITQPYFCWEKQRFDAIQPGPADCHTRLRSRAQKIARNFFRVSLNYDVPFPAAILPILFEWKLAWFCKKGRNSWYLEISMLWPSFILHHFMFIHECQIHGAAKRARYFLHEQVPMVTKPFVRSKEMSSPSKKDCWNLMTPNVQVSF